MNLRIIRNFAAIALMGGAMFVLNVREARAQPSSACLSQCQAQEEQCYYNYCYGLGYCPPQPQCQSQYQACVTACGG